jgi:3'(2'), 5'-bisphosphate nucleotidase
MVANLREVPNVHATHGSNLVDFNGEDRDAIATALANIALAAGPAVMDAYQSDTQSRPKADGSPVTIADERAEVIIVGKLRAFAPKIAIVAEEESSRGSTPVIGRRFFLVDPLDGTREFVARNGEFTINVALVEDAQPIAGAVYAPAMARIWFAGRQAFAAKVQLGDSLPSPGSWEVLRSRTARSRMTAVASRSHCDSDTEAFLSALDIKEWISVGSSIKFCMIAEGKADVYPRFTPTMEWDTAAADAVVRAAGGCVLQLDGEPLAYGKSQEAFRNVGFVCWGDARRAGKIGKTL